MTPDLLLHICCGPCSIMPVTRLREMGYNVIGLFRNPNIQPLTEYLRRREAAAEAARMLDMELVIIDDWDIVEWMGSQLPLAKGPERCHECCGSRLADTKSRAEKMGIPYFSSSLFYSIYQPHDYMRAMGENLSTNSPASFVYEDFRVYWREGIDKAKEWSLYRQPYCGCVFSEAERYAKKLKKLKNSDVV